MTKKLLLVASLMLTNAYALNDGFDFGEECTGGSGTFQQQINHYMGDYENAISVGNIPAGIKDLNITLTSDKDVDIRLYAGDDKLVHWPYGLLNDPTAKSATYKGVQVAYSGYNGTDGNKGHEYIKITGATPTAMTMKAFGYRAGYATVNYSWSGKENCNPNQGEGNFTQALEKDAISLVGTIPAGIGALGVTLKSDKDLDIQLYGEDGTAIVAWNPQGILSGARKQSIVYNGMNIEWSGYNGDGTGKGHEYIKITGNTTEKLTMKVFGYESGFADVTYSWDGNTNDGNASYVTMQKDTSYVISKGNIIEKISTDPKLEIAIDKYTGKTKVTLKSGEARIRK